MKIINNTAQNRKFIYPQTIWVCTCECFGQQETSWPNGTTKYSRFVEFTTQWCYLSKSILTNCVLHNLFFRFEKILQFNRRRLERNGIFSSKNYFIISTVNIWGHSMMRERTIYLSKYDRFNMYKYTKAERAHKICMYVHWLLYTVQSLAQS